MQYIITLGTLSCVCLCATSLFAQDTDETKIGASMTYEQTKKIEDKFRYSCLNAKEVTFKFYVLHPVQEEKTIIVKDKTILTEFANNFRFNSTIRFDRVKGLVPGMRAMVRIVFSEDEEICFNSSEVNLHSLFFTQKNGDYTDWCYADLSLDTILVYNHVFATVLTELYDTRPGRLSYDEYKKDYFSRSFLDDLEKRCPRLSFSSVRPLSERDMSKDNAETK